MKSLKEFGQKIPYRNIFLFFPLALLLHSFYHILILQVSLPPKEILKIEVNQLHGYAEYICWLALGVFILDSFIRKKDFKQEAVSFRRVSLMLFLFTLISLAYVLRVFYVLDYFGDTGTHRYTVFIYVLTSIASVLAAVVISRAWPITMATTLAMYLLYFASATAVLNPEMISMAEGKWVIKNPFDDHTFFWATVIYGGLLGLLLFVFDSHRDRDIGQAYNDLSRMDAFTENAKQIKARNLLISTAMKYTPPPKPPAPAPPKKPAIEFSNLEEVPDFIKEGFRKQDIKITAEVLQQVLDKAKTGK
jgi:cytochrome c oxidase subunit IV